MPKILQHYMVNNSNWLTTAMLALSQQWWCQRYKTTGLHCRSVLGTQLHDKPSELCALIYVVSVISRRLKLQQRRQCNGCNCRNLHSTVVWTCHKKERQDWLTEYGLTSHQTHYRSHQDGFLRVKWPNQQCQSTEGRKKGEREQRERDKVPCRHSFFLTSKLGGKDNILNRPAPITFCPFLFRFRISFIELVARRLKNQQRFVEGVCFCLAVKLYIGRSGQIWIEWD